MNNRFYAAIVFVCALLGATDASMARQRQMQLGGIGNLAGYVPRLMQDFGWTRQQALGAMANFAHESHGLAVEQIGMGSRGGFGWAQWTGARRWAFMSFVRSHGLAPTSAAANYAFLAHELRTNFAHVAQHMRRARTAYEATAIFARDYEGAFSPGAISAMSSRYRWAQRLASL
jgi:hypothetical protein